MDREVNPQQIVWGPKQFKINAISCYQQLVNVVYV